MKLDDERECHWGMGFEEKCGGVDDQKVIINDKRWDVKMNNKEALVKAGNLWNFQVLTGRRFFG